MPRYHSSIHRPVFPSQVSSYSSLSGALTPPPSQFISSRRQRVPQSASKISTGPICGPIDFDYIGQAGQGVSMADFSVRSQNAISQMVAGANEQILAGTGVVMIKLRIMVSVQVLSISQTRNRKLIYDFYSGLDTSTWILLKVCLRARKFQEVSSAQGLLCNSGCL